MNKTDGYTTDINYPAFFYKEMQPLWLHSVVGMQGFMPPNLATDFSLCELGCGIGINLLVAAACHPNANFVGVDFNANHLNIARSAARDAGLANITFVHADFATYASQLQTHAAAFDVITTHGVWSWIAKQHQQALLACVDAGLKSHGLFYLHYMCHPGSTDLLSIQHVLNVFAPHVPGNSSQQVSMGLKLLAQMANRGAFENNPSALRHIHNLQHKDANHLAHEFLTDHWCPQHAVDVHAQVHAETHLSYLCSADVFNNLDARLSIPSRMQGLIEQTKIPALLETLKDLARNSHQRMDVFQRNPTPLTLDQHNNWLEAMRFARLTDAPMHGPIECQTPIGPIECPAALCTPLLACLSSGPASFEQLAQLPAFAHQRELLKQTLQLLMLQHIIHPAARHAQTHAEEISGLQQWFHRNHIALTLMPSCGTGVVDQSTLPLA